ncbi:MAG: orotidine-5'-phosphate decarboxylase [Armatimonadetes bacterium]|nr:orotidine-5'-phosphate decarboxylase [Armatimonadota bacterium]MDE2205581.1 orotidine-5'-phosphate decarboxylase [Armatimonadota bacterium]
MPTPLALEPELPLSERIFCALDTDSMNEALRLVRLLSPILGSFKAGLQLLSAVGPSVVDELIGAGARRVFCDAKLCDIPNTVAGAMRALARTSAYCVTVHASIGSEGLEAAVAAAATGPDGGPRVLAVTLLTSISEQRLNNELGVPGAAREHVKRMAQIADRSGCHGVVASPLEIAAVLEAVSTPGFLVVTPGVRPLGSETGDQARVLSPAAAMAAGASFLVIGRPITGAADPVQAAAAIISTIETESLPRLQANH